jgi:ABC-type Zn uptake system ZnuABC Zn-binding protein ZnuA
MVISLLLAMVVTMAGGITQVEAKIRVVTTTMDLAALAEAIGGDRVEVESLLKGYQDPHAVEVRPSYMLKLNKADLFVKVGLDLEIWSQLLVEGSRNPRIFPGAPGYVDASQGVDLLEIPNTRVDRSFGDIHLFGNPHYWLDPLNGKIILENILAGLTRVSPSDAAYFRKNKEAYASQIDKAMARWLKQMEPYRGVKVVTYHNSWPNFVKRFGLNVVGYLEPKPGIPPSPSHLAQLVSRMRQEGVRVIIKEPYFPDAAPRLVAEQTGARVVVLSPSVGAVERANDYIALFDSNIGKLIDAFQEAGVVAPVKR